jgi:hypothetical protein
MPTDARPAPAGLGPTDPLYALRLIDRRSGLPLRANGGPVVTFTSTPHAAAAEALAGRDPALWEVRIDRIPAPPREAEG